jgi:Ca2+-binding EF-hand superfamily protein
MRVHCACCRFDRNKDGKIDAAELEAILTRGKGPHAFSPSVAARMAQDVVRHFGTDGVLNKEGTHSSGQSNPRDMPTQP